MDYILYYIEQYTQIIQNVNSQALCSNISNKNTLLWSWIQNIYDKTTSYKI